jgi:ribosomal protein S18 acetylase RimI-like enzyme
MSDFYRRRRVAIKDGTALLLFFLGFVWSGAFVWPFLGVQVNQGEMIRGLAYFLAAVLACAVVAGLIGLETGNLLGGLWERYHKQHRAVAAGGGGSLLAWAIPSGVRERVINHEGKGAPAFWPVPADATRVAKPEPGVTAPEPRSAHDIYYTTDGVYTASFIPLAERVRPMQYAAPRVREALARSINIGAWDGPRLVGVVRVLSDGYTFSAIADILVDPEYQRLGIGTALMRQALAATPDARLLIDAAPDCVGFFEKIGCDRGPTGFVMTTSQAR